MEVQTTQKLLLGAVKAVKRALPRGPSLPVLSHLRLDVSEDRLRLGATDLDAFAQCSVVADGREEGSFLVPGQVFARTVAALREAPVSLKADGEGRLLLTCAESEFRFQGLPLEDWPERRQLAYEEGWTLPAETLVALVGRTAYAAASEDHRPALQGVLLELEEDAIGMVATDGHRLSRARAETEASSVPDLDLVLPSGGLELAERFFKDSESLTVAHSESHVGLQAEDRTLELRRLDATYPEYEQVIPQELDRTARVDREAFLATVKRMQVLADQGEAHRLTLQCAADEALRFSVQTPDLGRAGDSMPMEFEGEDITIAFNAGYLADVLKRLPDGEVELRLLSPHRAAVLQPVEADGLEQLSLLMPLRLLEAQPVEEGEAAA